MSIQLEWWGSRPSHTRIHTHTRMLAWSEILTLARAHTVKDTKTVNSREIGCVDRPINWPLPAISVLFLTLQFQGNTHTGLQSLTVRSSAPRPLRSHHYLSSTCTSFPLFITMLKTQLFRLNRLPLYLPSGVSQGKSWWEYAWTSLGNVEAVSETWPEIEGPLWGYGGLNCDRPLMKTNGQDQYGLHVAGYHLQKKGGLWWLFGWRTHSLIGDLRG